MKNLIIATSNKNKIREFKQILADKYNVVSQAEAGFFDDTLETGKTFFDNALLKAKAASTALNADALADDSGLCVEALNGEPGVFSARYAGEHGCDKDNVELLLKNMKNIKDRRAKFCCSIVLFTREGKIIHGYGETEGTILLEPIGENGFGYDPIFFSKDLNCGFAVASPAQKNLVSHRFRALNDLLTKL